MTDAKQGDIINMRPEEQKIRAGADIERSDDRKEGHDNQIDANDYLKQDVDK